LSRGEGDALAGSLFLIGSGLFLFFKGFKLLRLRRQVEGLATSKIRSLAMGLVELAGLAKDTPTLLDPIYTRPCAYYSVKVEEERRSGKNHHWAVIYKRDSALNPFIIKDETGEALIMPAGADVHRTPTLQCQSGFFGSTSDPTVEAFLKSVKSWGRNVRLTAHIIREGDPVYILGHVSPQMQPRSPVAVDTQEAAETIRKNPTLMNALDTNSDGQIDPMEWDLGVTSIQKEMEQEKIKAEMNKPAAPKEIMRPLVQKSPDGLLVFGSDQEDLVSRLGWRAFVFTIGGPIMATAGVWILINLIKL
jgi:hypothetical protein